MRASPLGLLLLLSACDPAAIATFDIHPQPGHVHIDSSLVLDATRTGQDFARRYQLISRQSKECASGEYSGNDTTGGRRLGLSLCLAKSRDGFRYTLVEAITFSWGPKGAALRDELADTLRRRYGDAVVVNITRK